MNQSSLIQSLYKSIENLLCPLIPRDIPIALLWYEESFNFGDAAIWNGQVNLLKNHGLNVNYVCSDRNFSIDALRNAIGSSGIILLTGGGNFGDLYSYHNLRLDIISAFNGNPVIQLPQSAKFNRSKNLDLTHRIIANHGNITLLARDDMTLELFRRQFESDTVNVHLCPDMAFSAGEYFRPCESATGIVGLLRIDQESNQLQERKRIYRRSLENHLGISDGYQNTYRVRNNHGQMIEFRHNVLTDKRRAIELSDWYLLSITSNPAHYKALDYNTRAQLGVNLAMNILSRGRVVVTDRLHAYILCLQMGMRHVVIDNSYGKLSSFYQTWGKNCELTHFASSAEEAFELARELC